MRDLSSKTAPAVAAAAIVLAGCGLSMVEHLIFFPEKNYLTRPEDIGLKAEAVQLAVNEKVALAGWFFRAEHPAGTLLVLHGNAGNVSDRLPKAKGWLEQGFSVFLVDYRGYGESSGAIGHESDVYEDAERARAWLVDEKKVPADALLIHGESLGCAPALKMASEGKVRAVVLEAPFTTLKDLAGEHYGWVPDFFLAKYRFDNLARAPSVKVPVFILQGTEDEICPVRMGRELFEKLAGPKDAFWIEGGHHNDLPDVAGPEFFTRPAAFLKTQLSLQGEP